MQKETVATQQVPIRFVMGFWALVAGLVLGISLVWWNAGPFYKTTEELEAFLWSVLFWDFPILTILVFILRNFIKKTKRALDQKKRRQVEQVEQMFNRAVGYLCLIIGSSIGSSLVSLIKVINSP